MTHKSAAQGHTVDHTHQHTPESLLSQHQHHFSGQLHAHPNAHDSAREGAHVTSAHATMCHATSLSSEDGTSMCLGESGNADTDTVGERVSGTKDEDNHVKKEQEKGNGERKEDKQEEQKGEEEEKEKEEEDTRSWLECVLDFLKYCNRKRQDFRIPLLIILLLVAQQICLRLYKQTDSK